MRYFTGKDSGAVVREKLAYAGDDTKADALITAFLSARPGWTAQEVTQAAFDAAVVVVDQTQSRIDAVAALATGDEKLTRAILLVILDEINVIRQLPALAQAPRTVNQLKTAIQNKINAGTAD